MALPTSGRRSSSTRPVCFLIWNTLSSTRSPTKWRTEAFSTSASVLFTRGSWKPSRRYIVIG